MEATASGGAGGFRLRPAGGNGCIGITANDVATGAEAVEERCTGAADQRFLIRTG
ncbi:RICIN domain-containing protein [Streptomyces andamanensis]|uniref:RICIN domain-containing protein n=1 Tax=Streptomyces andamanensis TaxID=1565035 RepID=A0ABV8TR10_9ACTN